MDLDFYDALLANSLNGSGGGGGGDVTVEALNVTSNGTYQESGKAYSPVVVNVPTGITPSGTLSVTVNGTYDVTNYANADVNVPSSEQDLSDLKPVVFVDYDGTVVYNYTEEEFLAMNGMPSNPSHDGLTAQGWNWSLQNAKSFVEEYGCVCIGQNYITTDGLTKLYMSVDDYIVGKQFTLFFSVSSGTVTVDWGDGSASSTTSGTGAKTFTHIYDSVGNYTLTLKSNDATFSLGYNGSNNGVICNNSYIGHVSATALKKVEIGSGVIAFHRQCFSSCGNLESISISKQVQQFGSGTTANVFTSAFSLKCVVVPQECVLLGPTDNSGTHFTLQQRFISLPDTDVKNIGISGAVTSSNTGCELRIFSAKASENPGHGVCGAKKMKYFAFGGTFTTLPQDYCRINILVEKVVVPSTVTYIISYAIANMIGDLYMKPTTPPTLAHASNIINASRIYVPYSEDHSILEAYQTATNWSTYASQMVEESA